MFSRDVYKQRRLVLQKQLGNGLIILLGNNESPMNYPANTFPFRQDSTFLYYFGVDRPGFAGLIDIDENRHVLVGDDFTIDDIIWMGPQPKVEDFSFLCAADDHCSITEMKKIVQEAISKKRKIHFLPPYRPENKIYLASLLGIMEDKLSYFASTALIKTIVSQREIKAPNEISEIEKALDISWEMYQQLIRKMKPGLGECEMVGVLESIVAAKKSRFSFPLILSVHGETLHNHHHDNIMQANDLLICDSGAESPEHYASDITRTIPVSGRYSSQQREIYQVVISAREAAFAVINPGIPFLDAHKAAAKAICTGLKMLGLMKGNEEDAVNEGAHALFFPHGLGHMLGLDVHDMEDLGENFVGYNEDFIRGSQFGLAYLRMAKPVRIGHVLTVEPGIYFIPELIDLWQSEKKWQTFIDFNKVNEYRSFGGIRVEDDIAIDADGFRILGKPIASSIDEIEQAMLNS